MGDKVMCLSNPVPSACTTSGSAAYCLDEGSRLVVHPERGAFRVTPIQFKLLAFLHQHPGKLFTTREILVNVWGSDLYDDDLVRVTVWHLRKRTWPDIVDCVRMYGYGVGIRNCELRIAER